MNNETPNTNDPDSPLPAEAVPPRADAPSGETPHAENERPQRAAGDEFFDKIRKLGLARSDDHWIGGVSGAIAAKLRWDINAVRILFFASILLAGVGFVLYGIGWALLPDTRGKIVVEDTLKGDFRWALVGSIIFILVGLDNDYGGFFSFHNAIFGFWQLITAVLVLVVIYALVKSSSDQKPLDENKLAQNKTGIPYAVENQPTYSNTEQPVNQSKSKGWKVAAWVGAATLILMLFISAIVAAFAVGSRGEERITVTPENRIDDSYSFNAGERVLDLSDLRDETQKVVPVELGAGELTIILPEGERVAVSAKVGAGTIEWDTERNRSSRSGINIQEQFEEEDPIVELDINVGVGKLVFRE